MHGEMRECSQLEMKRDFISAQANIYSTRFISGTIRVAHPLALPLSFDGKEHWYVAHPPCNFVGLFTDRRDAEDYVDLLISFA